MKKTSFTAKDVTWRSATAEDGSASAAPQGRWKPSRRRYGSCQPPKKSVATSAATSTTSTKSLIMNIRCFAPEYSVK